MSDDQFTNKNKDDAKTATSLQNTKDDAEASQKFNNILDQRPLNVIQSCILVVVTAILTVVTTFNGYEHYVEMSKLLGHEVGSQGHFLFARVISITIFFAFAHFLYTGKNWARTLFIIYFIVTIYLLCSNFSITYKVYLENLINLDTIINLVQIAITFVVCCLLLTPDTRNWFKSLKEASKS